MRRVWDLCSLGLIRVLSQDRHVKGNLRAKGTTGFGRLQWQLSFTRACAGFQVPCLLGGGVAIAAYPRSGSKV